MRYCNDSREPSTNININISINICSIEIKWDGKKTKIWYDNEMRWTRITVWNGGDEHINDYLFIDTYDSNKMTFKNNFF